MTRTELLWSELVHVSQWFVGIVGREVLYSTVVLVVVLALSRLARRAHPLLHLGLWALVFVRLLLPPDLGHSLSIGALGSMIAETTQARVVEAGSFREAVEVQEVPGGAPVPGLQHRGQADAGWQVAAMLTWLLGSSAYMLVLWRRRRVVSRHLRAARPVDDARVLAVVDQWRRRLSVRRPVRVVTADSRVAPFATGVLQPTVFLPRAVLAEHGLAEIVVAHEMVHVARWDAVWMHVQQVIQALYFFHPGVWFAGFKLSHERERVCDASVLRFGVVDARDYARRLIDVAALELAPADAPALRPVVRSLKSRVLSVRDAGKRSGGGVMATVVCLAVAFFVLPLAGGVSAAPESLALQGQSVASAAKVVQGESAGTPDVTLINPLPGARVTATYGNWIDPFSGEKAFHRGIDLAQRSGTAIRAPADGVVRVAEVEYQKEPAAGTVIIIDHGDGLSTFYSHLGRLDVETGEIVSQGQTIAAVGSTGRSTGPHLHFEVRVDGRNVDPKEVVQDW